MAICRGDLDRLTIGTSCPASWEGMEGDRARRFCGECRRHVFDFERMTPARSARGSRRNVGAYAPASPAARAESPSSRRKRPAIGAGRIVSL